MNALSTSTAAQRARLLKHLREVGPISTMQARELLNIMHPAGRVMELRKRGYDIRTIRIIEHDHQGRPHRVGRYALMPGG